MRTEVSVTTLTWTSVGLLLRPVMAAPLEAARLDLAVPALRAVKLASDPYFRLILEFTCPAADGYYANPADCLKFYRCASGVKYSFDCPPGNLTFPSGEHRTF